MKTLCFVFLTGAALVAAQGESIAQTTSTPAQAATAGAGNAENGKDVFVRYSCYACHGYAAHAGPGGRLAPMRFPLPAFRAFVRSPRTMPPYTAKVLSDAQLDDVWAYIRALPESPPAKSIPLLNQP